MIYICDLFQRRPPHTMDGSSAPHKSSTCEGTNNNPAKQILPKPSSTNQSSTDKAVNFTPSPGGEKKREKYLTAKYGAHQMALIRKRLKVEMWMFDQLQEICESEVIEDEEKKIFKFNHFNFRLKM